MDHRILHDMPRSIDRASWTRLYHRMRTKGLRSRDFTGDSSLIGERARLQAEINECTDALGRVAIVENGRDCDGVVYCHARIEPSIRAIALQLLRDDIYRWADGPCWVGVCHPEDAPVSYSRDLTLEAFEDGHPHAISEVRYDDEGAY